MYSIEPLERRQMLSSVDLWVDSSNSDGMGAQTVFNHTPEEDAIEDDASRPGKIGVRGGGRLPLTLVTEGVDFVRFNFDPTQLRLWDRRTDAGGSIVSGALYPIDTFERHVSGRLVFVSLLRPTPVPGAARVGVEALNANAFVARDAVRFSILTGGAFGDTDRNGTIDPSADQPAKIAARSDAQLGALVLPNLDRDNPQGVAPDNWRGGDWDGDYVSEDANDVIDGAEDLADLSEVLFARLGTGVLPPGVSVRLTLREPVEEHIFFTGVRAKDRVRVFLEPGLNDRRALLGPEAGRRVTFTQDASDPNRSVDLFTGTGTLKLYVEGIEQGAAVDIVMQVLVNGRDIYSNSVRFRVAPFVLIGHEQAVSREPGSVVVTRFNKWDGTDLNADLRQKLLNVFGESLLVDAGEDPWVQDGYEVGYAQVPGKSMPVALELVRARDRGGFVKDLLRRQLLAPGFGVNVRILNGGGALDFGSQDLGGNIETLPAPDGRNYFFHGAGMFDEHRNFFLAQGVNPELEVDVSWLLVGHVDEVVSLAPDGKRVAIADSELAWALLLWAQQLDPTARMSQGMNEGISAAGIGVGDALDQENGTDLVRGPILRSVQVDANNPVRRGLYRLRDDVVRAMGLTDAEPVSTPARGKGNAGTALLDRAGAFTAMLTGPRDYRVTMSSMSTFSLAWRDAGATVWQTSEVTGSTSGDVVFPDAKAYVFSNWWNEGAGDLVQGDTFTFSADPNAAVVPIPIAFGAYDFGNGPQAYAYTTDHINALVDGQTVVTGRAFGPKVDHDQNGTKTDILQDYVKAAFGKVYTRVVFADARAYHNGIGSIHCATNVWRDAPSGVWWETPVSVLSLE